MNESGPAIDYHHARNLHTLRGAIAALRVALRVFEFNSILDVGCGTGTWLRAAFDAGIRDIFGIDGVEISEQDFLVSKDFFLRHDLTRALDLKRRFDIVLCLEVGEHLPPHAAQILIDTLTLH